MTTVIKRAAGGSFDSKLSYGYHIHRTAIRATQRLHFLRKAAVVLCTRGRAVVYKGFVRPLMEYSPLMWVGAAPTHLNKLDRVQLRALKIIGPTSALQTLHASRTVAAATYMYKLRCSDLACTSTTVFAPSCHATSQHFTHSEIGDRCHVPVAIPTN